MMCPALRILVSLVFLLASPAALASGDDNHHESGDHEHDCGSACPVRLEVSLADFQAWGAGTPNGADLYLGRDKLTPDPVTGLYTIALTNAEGHFIRDAFDLKRIQQNGLPNGVALVVRLGKGKVIVGLFGYFKNGGKVYMKIKTTVRVGRLLRFRSYSHDRLEHDGDGIYKPGKASQDESKVSGNMVIEDLTVTTRADLGVLRATCKGADLCDGTVCAASDQCHDAGQCNPATGICTNPPKPDGSSCDDNDACTQTDTCQSGKCQGSNPVVCPAPDQCHLPGSCDPADGSCSNPLKEDGATCNDANECTRADTCQNGTCVGEDPVVCDEPSVCHDLAGAYCDTKTAECVYPPSANGTACDDGNKCTQTDQCWSGKCEGLNLTQCTTPDDAQCQDSTGSCDPETGTCSYPNVDNTTPCEDGSLCTVGDTCQSGQCQSGTTLDCNDNNTCTSDSCNPLTAR
jgi:hypothetical protein